MSTGSDNKVYQRLNNAQFWLLPGICLICGKASRRPRDLCAACESSLPFIQHPCPCCGLPLPAFRPQQTLCGACARRPPLFRHCICPFHYRPPVDRLIAGLKFHGRLPAGRLLGFFLLETLRAFYHERERPGLIIPVPLHPGRLRRRGYNQALELARQVSSGLGLPVDWRSCSRELPTRPQTGLSAHERRRNLKGAFRLAAPLLPARVALMDDVVTTMSTVQEITRLLLDTGVREVHVWAAARA